VLIAKNKKPPIDPEAGLAGAKTTSGIDRRRCRFASDNGRWAFQP
jgi:hypothetical protein